MCRIGGAQVLKLADEVEQLRCIDLCNGLADGIECGDAGWESHALRHWRESAGVGTGYVRRHTEVRRRRRIVLVVLVVVVVLISSSSAVVIAVVHSQRAPIQVEFVQISHGRSGGIDVGVFEETKTFGLAGLLVVDQAEVDDLPAAAEDVHDLLLADAVRDVADEDHPPAFLSLRHVGRYCDDIVGKRVVEDMLSRALLVAAKEKRVVGVEAEACLRRS